MSTPFGHLGPARLPDEGAPSWTLATTPLPMAGRGEPIRINVSGARIVCDVDGLLVNSEQWILRAIFETVQDLAQSKFGGNYTLSPRFIEEMKVRCFGVSDVEMSTRAFRLLLEEDLLPEKFHHLSPDRFVQLFRELRSERYIGYARANLIQPMPGAVEFIEAAFNHTGPLGISTGNPAMYQVSVLQAVFGKHLDLNVYFPPELRVFIDTPGNEGKPSPRGYELVAARMGVSTSSIIAVEDRPNGTLSALRAGCRLVLAVPENLSVKGFFYGKNSVVDIASQRTYHPVVVADALSQIELFSAPR